MRKTAVAALLMLGLSARAAFLQTATVAGLISLCFIVSAWPQLRAKPIGNPDTFAEDVMQKFTQGRYDDVANLIFDTMGQPSQGEAIKTVPQIFAGKRFDYSTKVIDNSFGKGLRQIVYYANVEGLGFIYFRFNLKMTSKGWVLANFTFKEETAGLFPKDFVDRY
jgi:hypothetical protein